MSSIKKIFACLLILAFSVTAFVGCSFFQLDVMRQRNDPIVLKDGKVWVTTGELIDAYASYGSSYTSSTAEGGLGLSVADALDRTLTMVMNRKIVLEAVADRGITLTDNDKKKARSTAYEYVENALGDLEDEIRAEWDMTIPVEENPIYTAVEEPMVYSPFVQTMFWDDATSSYIYVNQDKDPDAGFVPEVENWIPTVSTKDVSDEAVKRLARLLMVRYKGVIDTKIGQIDKQTDNLKVIRYEINRAVVLEEENLLLQKFQEEYGNSQNVPSEHIMEKYQQLVMAQYKEWLTGEMTEETFTTRMITGAGLTDLYYYDHNALSKNFFTVSHVLLKMTDQQNQLVKDKKAELAEGGITETDYEKFLTGDDATENDGLVSEIKAVEKYLYDENGELEDAELLGQIKEGENLVAKTAPKILAELISKEGTTGFSDLFRDYTYMYGEDGGMNGNVTGYVMSTVKEDNQMIEEFTDECLALYERSKNEGKDQLVSRKLILTEYEEGKYGVHIIMFNRTIDYVNIVKNLESITSLNVTDLYNTKVSYSTTQNFFNLVADKLATSNYSNFENEIVNSYRANVKIEVYKDKVKALLEN